MVTISDTGFWPVGPSDKGFLENTVTRWNTADFVLFSQWNYHKPHWWVNRNTQHLCSAAGLTLQRSFAAGFFLNKILWKGKYFLLKWRELSVFCCLKKVWIYKYTQRSWQISLYLIKRLQLNSFSLSLSLSLSPSLSLWVWLLCDYTIQEKGEKNAIQGNGHILALLHPSAQSMESHRRWGDLGCAVCPLLHSAHALLSYQILDMYHKADEWMNTFSQFKCIAVHHTNVFKFFKSYLLLLDYCISAFYLLCLNQFIF